VEDYIETWDFISLFLIIMISMATSFMEREIPPQVFTYTQFLDAVQRGLVQKVVIINRDLSGEMKGWLLNLSPMFLMTQT